MKYSLIKNTWHSALRWDTFGINSLDYINVDLPKVRTWLAHQDHQKIGNVLANPSWVYWRGITHEEFIDYIKNHISLADQAAFDVLTGKRKVHSFSQYRRTFDEPNTRRIFPIDISILTLDWTPLGQRKFAYTFPYFAAFQFLYAIKIHQNDQIRNISADPPSRPLTFHFDIISKFYNREPETTEVLCYTKPKIPFRFLRPQDEEIKHESRYIFDLISKDVLSLAEGDIGK